MLSREADGGRHDVRGGGGGELYCRVYGDVLPSAPYGIYYFGFIIFILRYLVLFYSFSSLLFLFYLSFLMSGFILESELIL